MPTPLHRHAPRALCARTIAWAMLCASMALLPLQGRAAPSDPPRVASELQVTAAYLYNFLRFVQWPSTANSATAAIVIVGHDGLAEEFRDVKGRPIGTGGPVLAVRSVRDARDPELTALLEACRLVFVHAATDEEVAILLDLARTHPILTVGDSAGFADVGGMVNLVHGGGGIRWEINREAARREGLSFQAQLLRNATRVLETTGVHPDDPWPGDHP